MGRSIVISIVIVLSALSTTSARTWLIRPDGTGDAPTIQAGIDSAATGDAVALAEGVFRGEGNRDIDFHGKRITVYGATRPQDCVIDCQGSEGESHRGFFFDGEEGTYSTLGNLKIINGYANGGGAVKINGGRLLIGDCHFSYNHSTGDGGAIDGTRMDILNCIFDQNSADGSGGAIAARCGAWIAATRFSSNSAGEGGALAVGQACSESPDSCFVEGCELFTNEASLNGGAVIAGGVRRISPCGGVLFATTLYPSQKVRLWDSPLGVVNELHASI